MKRRISIFALSFLLFMTSWISATAVKAETTYTWEYVGGSFCGTEEGDMRVMHQKINETHSDGEQNYADLYCALQLPPKSIPADKELALKVKLYGTVYVFPAYVLENSTNFPSYFFRNSVPPGISSIAVMAFCFT